MYRFKSISPLKAEDQAGAGAALASLFMQDFRLDGTNNVHDLSMKSDRKTDKTQWQVKYGIHIVTRFDKHKLRRGENPYF